MSFMSFSTAMLKSLPSITIALILLLLVYPARAEGPPPGHPSVDEAARLLQIPRDQVFTYQGEVIEVINSNGYTYIHAQVLEEKLWLAAPRLDLKKGQQIRFPPGSLMRNFYSRRLKRTFPMVIFVSGVDIVPEQT